MTDTEGIDEDAVARAIRRQREDPEEHDRGLIAERLRLSPEQRLRDLEAMLAFVEKVRPEGPLVDWTA